jgi:ribosomal protein S27AE
MALFAVPLYLNQKNSRLRKLQNGTCPSCGATPTSFYDEVRKVSFENPCIKKELLKSHGCSGTQEIKYTCMKCGLVEVHGS